MQARRSVNVAFFLVGTGLMIHVINSLRMLHGIRMMMMHGNWRWLAVNFIAPVIIAVALFALARGWNWARPALLIVTLAIFAEICWQIGFLYQRSPDEMSLFMIPSFLLGRVLPLILYWAALHWLFFRPDKS